MMLTEAMAAGLPLVGLDAANALQTADDFSISSSASKALTCYETLHKKLVITRPQQYESLKQLPNLLKIEWEIVKGMASATNTAFEDN
ncbi:MAG: hypothetical protein MUR51_10390 [Pseudomonadota bacterium]|nr:hypothetical protein [Pseudomonadota bacterium]